MEKSIIVKERAVKQDIGRDLEQALQHSKQLDREISRSLNYSSGPLRYLTRIPIISSLVSWCANIKPLSALEYSLRSSVNSTAISVARIGERTQYEKDRIQQLEEILQTSIKEEWGKYQFLQFIENNTDISLIVSTDNGEYDFKELITSLDLIVSPQEKEKGIGEYRQWLKDHITLSKDYLDSMHALCVVGTKWLEQMLRSYFTLSQLRGEVEQIQKTLRAIGEGAKSSFSSEESLREYGKTYVEGMKRLVEGYNKLSDMRRNSNGNEFRACITELESSLNMPTSGNSPKRQLQQGAYKHKLDRR